MNHKVLVVAVCLLLAACAPADKNGVEAQVKGNQGVLLVLQNAGDLDHMYFNYYGPDTDGLTGQSLVDKIAEDAFMAAKARGASDEDAYEAARQAATLASSNGVADGDDTHPSYLPGYVQIGELNMLIHNVGGSVTAGGLYVSGYDPNLITVASRLGQNPINNDQRDCYKELHLIGTGEYSVTLICEATGNTAIGGNINTNNGNTNVVVSGFNLPLAEWADKIASAIMPNGDVEFFTKFGLFTQNRVDCGVQNGRWGCSIRFGNPAFNPNRATHGYLLLNLFYADLANCGNKCRVFPPRAPTEALSGVEDLSYPAGEALYYDYDIFLDTKKWNSLLNDLKQTFQVTACYFYTTTVTPTVCVDPDPTTNRNEPCSTGPITFKGTQGAPVRVSKIEQRSQPGGTAFTIHIEHVGNGQLYLPGGFEQCSPWNPNRPDRRIMDAVYLLDARISGDMQQLKCLPEGKREIRLTNGKGQITCLYPINPYTSMASRQAYLSAITLEFGYVYQNVVQKDVLIHRT